MREHYSLTLLSAPFRALASSRPYFRSLTGITDLLFIGLAWFWTLHRFVISDLPLGRGDIAFLQMYLVLVLLLYFLCTRFVRRIIVLLWNPARISAQREYAFEGPMCLIFALHLAALLCFAPYSIEENQFEKFTLRTGLFLNHVAGLVLVWLVGAYSRTMPAISLRGSILIALASILCFQIIYWPGAVLLVELFIHRWWLPPYDSPFLFLFANLAALNLSILLTHFRYRFLPAAPPANPP